MNRIHVSTAGSTVENMGRVENPEQCSKSVLILLVDDQSGLDSTNPDRLIGSPPWRRDLMWKFGQWPMH